MANAGAFDHKASYSSPLNPKHMQRPIQITIGYYFRPNESQIIKCQHKIKFGINNSSPFIKWHHNIHQVRHFIR